jgi:hypothetical protein
LPTQSTQSYTYDALGRLSKRTDGSGAVLRGYAWDSLGRMLSAQLSGSTGSEAAETGPVPATSPTRSSNGVAGPWCQQGNPEQCTFSIAIENT